LQYIFRSSWWNKRYNLWFSEEGRNGKKNNNEIYDNLIDIEKYVKPKKEDDLNNIFSLIERLKNFIIKNANLDMKLIKYSSLIIERYSELYEEINKLIYLY